MAEHQELPFDGREISLAEAADTEAFGFRLAQVLVAGDLVVLDGPLGAGKTAMTRGIAAGLGVQGRVSSPTFVIAREHRPGVRPDGSSPVALVHVDAYRLGMTGQSAVDELDALDLDTDLTAAVVVVEWGEGLVEKLSDGHISVRIRRDPESDTRTVQLRRVESSDAAS
ncbi:tRNA (adenosine(37)-N6)-threonylcarbamoyltransferase complex ATPase subunit type 1 TsaE [Rhodococcoides kyotonense]|uniref:tRNA threonylcarbamoyladenosine biosynthesis protein TsaE n=1 Tax=Rhodococcoides kyotonense TaxID=398843 RepID=A0A239MN92_9NOCA|nr:tRNA (adenosine(37)-N6)-threonylcarbamoyltransferase complex ATPase subunit type 1 TsaE [Rhodococcus kyotonensis]SNT44327.1 tRNA threonylcarbamoyladenosine biosynthesis protein TsaE [Rhodococcus kyotonensis]